MVLHEYYKLLKRKIRSKKAVVSQLRGMGSESRTAASKIIKQAFKDKNLDLPMYYLLLPSFDEKSMTLKFERSLLGTTQLSSPRKEKTVATIKLVEDGNGAWKLKSFTQRSV